MIPVSSLDAGMLYAETPEMPMHTLGVVVIERPEKSAFEVMRRLFEERMHLIAPLRRRLIEGPLRIGDPHWIEDPDFDLDKHLRRAAIPSPGSTRELADFVGDLAGRALERSKPLWEVVLVEGLEDGQIAVVAKVHHAAMDGGRVVALLLGCLFDLDPEGTPIPPPETEWTAEPMPSWTWLATDTVRSLRKKPLNALRALAEVATTIGSGVVAHRGEERHDTTGDAHLFEAPKTPFSGALTPHRSVALTEVPLDDIRAIKRAFATTVNDVVLAASAGALRTWLLAHGGLPDRPLVVNVPITVRGAGGASDEDTGNRVSMMLVHLPVQLDDPVERLRAIHAETDRRKQRHGRGGGHGGDVLTQFTDVVMNISVPWVLTHVMKLYSASHLADRLPVPWSLVISNLPGPPVQLYCAGAKVRQVYPLGPVQHGSGLNLTVLSVAGRLCFGAMACKEMVPDVEALGSGFVDEVAVLKALAAEQA